MYAGGHPDLQIEFLEFCPFIYHFFSEAGRSDAAGAEQEKAKNALKRPISLRGMRMKRDVFISYASEDREFVSQLATGLRNAGLTVWRDRDELTSDESHGSKIEDAIINSRFAIAVISKRYLVKKWPEAEFGAIRKLEEHENRDRIIVVFGNPASGSGIPFGRKPIKHMLTSDKGADWAVSECLRLIQELTEEQDGTTPDARYKYIFPLGRYSYCGELCPKCGAPMVVGNHSFWCSKCDYIDEMEPV